MKESTKTALAVLVVIAIAGAFWLVLLAPKRDKANELGERVTAIQSEVSTEQARTEAGLEAKKNFSSNYSELVGLGTAVPAEAATPSLLVQLKGVSNQSETEFKGITADAGSGEATEGAVESTEEGAAIPTEGTAALPPLGAGVGPAGLLSMPYQLQFEGGFFQIANFIHGIDSLVQTRQGAVQAKGRLMTIDSFTLGPASTGEESSNSGAPPSKLSATFSVTTYVTPPGQGLTAGASPSGPSEETTAEIP